MARKYPIAWRDSAWQWALSTTRVYVVRDAHRRRHHLHQTLVQRAVKDAVRSAGPTKCHTFRHSFATQLIQAGYDIRTVLELLGP